MFTSEGYQFYLVDIFLYFTNGNVKLLFSVRYISILSISDSLILLCQVIML